MTTATVTKEQCIAVPGPGDKLGHDLTIIQHQGGSRKVDLYLCRSRALKREVACKVLRPEHRQRISALKGLEREGRILTLLQHENLVEGYGYNLDEPPRIVMEQLDGMTLETAWLTGNGSAFRIEDAVEVGLCLAKALEYIHARGILHLDVKPSNVMYLDGHATLFDFSVARLGRAGQPLIASAGTTEYKAPEQTFRRPLGPYTDVFGLGVTLYELLTEGKMPYRKEWDKTAGAQKGHNLDYRAAPVRPHDVNPAVPNQVARVVMKAISPVPGDRYQSAAEFKMALASV